MGFLGFGKGNNIIIRASEEKIIETVDISACGKNDTYTVAPGCKVVKIVDGIRRPGIVDSTKNQKTKIFEHGENVSNVKLLVMNTNVNHIIRWGTGDLVYKARGVNTKEIGLRGEVKFRAVQFTSLIDKGIYDATAERIRGELLSETVSIANAAFAELSSGVKLTELKSLEEKIAAIIKIKLPTAADTLGYPIVIEGATAIIHVPEEFWEEANAGGSDRLFGDPVVEDDTRRQSELLEKWGTANNMTPAAPAPAPAPAPKKDEFCSKCNAKRIDGSAFCNRCGKKF